MNFKGWWYDYKIKMGLLSHVDRFMPHAEAAWNAAQAQRAEAGALLLATEKGLTPLGKLIDACQAMLKDINYTRGLAEGSIGKGAGNRMADALDELLPSMNNGE